jgi:hypothetical protein
MMFLFLIGCNDVSDIQGVVRCVCLGKAPSRLMG